MPKVPFRPAWFAGFVLVASLLCSGAALGQNRQDRAREFFERGRQLYAEKKYDEALDTLMQAYVLDPNPILVYNIARVHQDKDDLENAVRFFENYLKIAPKARDRAAVKKRIKELTKILKTRPPRGYLTIDSIPPGGTVRIDGLVVGQAPIQGIPIVAGRRVVEVTLDGHEPWRSDVSISGGRTLTLSAPLRDRPSPVFIETFPAGVDVSLVVPGAASQALGRCPCSVLLGSGSHTLEGKALGYQSKVLPIVKRAGEPLTVRMVLEAENTTGELTISSAVNGSLVRVDGQTVGNTPLSASLLLRAGTVEVEVTAPGHEPFIERVTVMTGARQTVFARLRPIGGSPVMLIDDSKSSAQHVAGWTVLGLGIAGLVAGGSLHTVALVRAYDYKNSGAYQRVALDGGGTVLLREDATQTGAKEQETISKGLELGGFIGYGVGGGMIIIGAILLATDTRDDLNRLGNFAPSVIPLDGGALGSLTWTFQ